MNKETAYKHESTCQDCGATYTSDVLMGKQKQENGNYTAWWHVPAHCEVCAEQYYMTIRHEIDPIEMYLPRWRYIPRYLFGWDPKPMPRQLQEEPIDE